MPELSQFTNNLVFHSVTIANTATVSDAADLSGTSLVGFFMPSAWTAADISFKVSADNSNFVDVYDTGGAKKTAAVAASRFVTLEPADFAGLRFLKLESSVAQGASRAITLVTRPL